MKQFLAAKFEGHSLPGEWLSLAIAQLDDLNKAGKAAFSVLVADKDGNKCRLVSFKEDKIPPQQELEDLLAGFKDVPVIVCLHEVPAGMQSEDFQPFEMFTNRDDELVCAGFALGQFPGSAKKGSSHTDAFHLMTEVVRPELLELYDICENSINEFSVEIQGKKFTRSLEDRGTETNIILMCASTPDVVVQGYLKNWTQGAELDFGYVSDTLGFGAKPEQAKEPAKPLTLLEKMAAKISGKPASTAAEGAAPVIAAPAKADPVKSDPITNAVKETAKDVQYYQCPHGMSNGQAKEAYQRHAGFIPSVENGFLKPNQSLKKERPKVPVQLKGMDALATHALSTTAVSVDDNKVIELPKTPGEVRSTPDEHKPIEVKEPAINRGTHAIPDKERKAFQGSFLKIPDVVKTFDAHFEEIMPPHVAEEMTGDKPSVNAELGIDGGIERWDTLKTSHIMTLALQAPRLLARLFVEERYRALTALQSNATLRDQLGKARGNKTEALPPPLKTAPATVPATPATSPAPASTPSETKHSASGSFGNMPKRVRKTA